MTITINPYKTCYLFDVDGTLAEPKAQINENFKKQFITWSQNKQLFIATGSEYIKTKQQISLEMINCFKAIFCCMGNEVRYPSGNILHKNEIIFPDQLEYDLSNLLQNSDFPYRTGNHIEYRTGMINFSIVGRNANPLQRKEYLEWDKLNSERHQLVSFINDKFTKLEASIGGMISIDIIQKGYDKGQIVKYISDAAARKIVFVGDKCFPGGNDYGIIKQLENSDLDCKWFHVSDPNHTLSLLKNNKVFF